MSPLCARLEDEDPQGVAPPEWRIPIRDPVQPGEPVLPQAIQELILVRLHVLATQEEGQDQSFEVIVYGFLTQNINLFARKEEKLTYMEPILLPGFSSCKKRGVTRSTRSCLFMHI